MSKFGESSLEKLKLVHPDLKKVMELAIERSNVDFGISEGHRTVEVQQSYYAIGRTKELNRTPITNVDGINKKGKHNELPSHAVDIYIYHPDAETRKKIAYDGMHLAYVAGIVDACAQELCEKGLITHKIRWGGNWDSDGVIIFDQQLQDMPHFEIE